VYVWLYATQQVNTAAAAEVRRIPRWHQHMTSRYT